MGVTQRVAPFFDVRLPAGRWRVQLVEEWVPDRWEVRGIDYGPVTPPAVGPWLLYDEWTTGGTKVPANEDREAFFRELALVPVEPRPVAEFARRYGPLFWRLFFPSLGEASIALERNRRAKFGFSLGKFAESYWDWAWHIITIRGLVNLTFLAGGKPSISLGPREDWRISEFGREFGGASVAEVWARFPWATEEWVIRELAFAGVPADVRKYWRGTAWPLVAWLSGASDARLEAEVHVMSFVRELCWPVLGFGRGTYTRLRAEGVLPVAYASFAEHLAGGIPAWRLCACGEWFELVGRRDQMRCSPDCKAKQRDKRERRKNRRASLAVSRSVKP